MNSKNSVLTLIIAVCCLLVLQPVLAAGSEGQTVIYQTSFASDPLWKTNNPSTNYWDPNMGMYHFSIEPSTGSYVYTPVEFDSGSFTLDYDFILNRIDDGATFRMGLSGTEMDFNKGPNVVSLFTNAKYGKIMWLHIVSPGSKMVEMNSQNAAVEMGPDAYKGPTAKYAVNKTYHVTVNYNADTKITTMKVRESDSGQELWSYFIQSTENMKDLNRIFLGSKGDYGPTFIYAQGYIDNVRLTVPSAGSPVIETPVETQPVPTEPVPVTPTKKPTPKMTVPTPYPTGTPQSPPSGFLPIVAFGICGALCYISARKQG
jgi:hypothetical protein